MQNLTNYIGGTISGFALGIMLLLAQVTFECAENGKAYSHPLLGETINCEWSR